MVGRWKNISTTVAFAEGYRDIIGKLFLQYCCMAVLWDFFLHKMSFEKIPKGEGEIYEKIINPYLSSNAIT